MVKKILATAGLTLSMLFASQAAMAQTLSAHSFEDQWEKQQVLDNQVQWLVYSTHKDGGKWVKESLQELGWTDLKSKQLLYVADISAMPSLITKFIAIPNMQDYPFPIALDTEGEVTADWPQQEEKVNVYRLNQLNIEEAKHLSSKEEVMAFLKSIH